MHIPICIFEEKLISISELEKALHFKYVTKNIFLSLEEEKKIKQKGLEQKEKGEIKEETLLLGEQFFEKIQSLYMPSLSVRFVSDAMGYGLFAEEDLEKNTYLGTYTGLIRENKIQFLKPLNNYLHEYPIPDELGRSFVIDAEQGNLTRFINHSTKPNLKAVQAFHNGFYHLIFLTLDSIKKGSQLFNEYQKGYWYTRKKPIDL